MCITESGHEDSLLSGKRTFFMIYWVRKRSEVKTNLFGTQRRSITTRIMWTYVITLKASCCKSARNCIPGTFRKSTTPYVNESAFIVKLFVFFIERNELKPQKCLGIWLSLSIKCLLIVNIFSLTRKLTLELRVTINAIHVGHPCLGVSLVWCCQS